MEGFFMVDADTGECLVVAGGVVAPELQYELFLKLRWALAHAGLLSLSDRWHCTFEDRRLVARFFPQEPLSKRICRPTRPTPVSGALADDPEPWPGLAVERGDRLDISLHK
jgi:hypothetical protein